MADRIKLQIGMPMDMVHRIDKLASEMGMTRSQLCAYFIGNGVRQTEMQSYAVNSMVSQLTPVLQQAMQQEKQEGTEGAGA